MAIKIGKYVPSMETMERLCDILTMIGVEVSAQTGATPYDARLVVAEMLRVIANSIIEEDEPEEPIDPLVH